MESDFGGVETSPDIGCFLAYDITYHDYYFRYYRNTSVQKMGRMGWLEQKLDVLIRGLEQQETDWAQEINQSNLSFDTVSMCECIICTAAFMRILFAIHNALRNYNEQRPTDSK